MRITVEAFIEGRMKLDAGKKSGRGSLPVGAAGFTAPPCLGEAISRDVAPTATGVACRSRPLIRGGGGGGGAPGAEAARQGVARLEGFLDFFSDGHLVVGPHKVEQDGLQRGAGHQRPGLLEYDGKPFCLGRVALPGGISQVFQCGDGGVGVEGC